MASSASLTLKTLLLSFGRMVASLSAILITVILARFLSVEDFGLHKKAILAFAICSPALALGLPKALFFFLPGNLKDGRAFLVANLSILTLVGLLFSFALVFVFGEYAAATLGDDRLDEIWWMIGIYAVAMLPLGSTAATLVAQNRVPWMVKFQVASQSVLVLMVGVSASAFGDPRFTIGAMMLWAVLSCIAAIILMLKATSNIGEVHQPNWSHFKVQLQYSVPLGLASMFGSISTQMDKLVVSSLRSTEEFSLYVAGAIELPIIGVVTGAMNAAILPSLTTSYKSGRLAEIVDLWRRAMGKSATLLIPCFGAVLLFSEDIVVLLYGPEYGAAAQPLQVYACLLPLRCAVYGSVLMATDRTVWVTYTALLGLFVNAALSYTLIMWLDSSIGAAWATVISMYAVVGVMLPIIAKTLKVRVGELFDFVLLGKIAVCTIAAASFVFGMRSLVWDHSSVGFYCYATLYIGVGLGGYRAVGLPGPRTLISSLKRRTS